MAGLSRRELFKRLVPDPRRVLAEDAEKRREVINRPERRPPGAVTEPLFLQRCTRCGDCVTACPHAAIYTFTEAAGVKAETPVMAPDRAACHLCEGFPCAAACAEAALMMPETPAWPLGTVRIATERCIAFQGPECGACVGLCPSSVVGIRLTRWRPEVITDACVGCGLCIEACPVMPRAIELLPLALP